MANWDITTAGSALTITTSLNNSHIYTRFVKIDANHFWGLYSHSGSGNLTDQTIFAVNTSTWAVTTVATGNFGYQTPKSPNLCLIDSNHALAVWGFENNTFNNYSVAQVISFNTSTYAVSTLGGGYLAFSTGNQSATYNSEIIKIDTNHFLVYYTPYGNAYAQVLTVNTSTWVVTTSSSKFTFATNNYYAACVPIDTTHSVVMSRNTSASKFELQTIVVNTSTWAVTTAGAVFQDTDNNNFSPFLIDTNHFLVYKGNTIQVYTVNTSTWAISTSSSVFSIDTAWNTELDYHARCCQVDSNHFIVFYSDSSQTNMYSYSIAVNTSTWAVTTAGSRFTFVASSSNTSMSNTCVKIDTSHILNFYGANYNTYAQVFTVSLPVPTNIKTIDGLAYASVKTVDGLAIASVKTFNGLA